MKPDVDESVPLNSFIGLQLGVFRYTSFRVGDTCTLPSLTLQYSTIRVGYTCTLPSLTLQYSYN